MKSIEVKAPAKINIGLSIIEKRPDGFHNLETLFYPIIDLYDVIKFELDTHFSFKSNDSSLPTDENNLIVKAKDILEKVSNKKISAKIYLQKNIPSGAGLGGGSSDSAAALLCLNELFSLGLNFETLSNLALELGSDVPFFLMAKPAIGKGRGEILKLVDVQITKPILIINPNIHVSTKEAFSGIIPSQPNYNYDMIVVSINDLNFLKNNVKNDFEQNIFTMHPDIKSIKDSLYANRAEFALMTGTGSTVFGIFENQEKAMYAKKSLPDEYFSFISCP